MAAHDDIALSGVAARLSHLGIGVLIAVHIGISGYMKHPAFLPSPRRRAEEMYAAADELLSLALVTRHDDDRCIVLRATELGHCVAEAMLDAMGAIWDEHCA